MNQYLKTIQDLLQKNGLLSEQDKELLLKAVNDADKQWNITDFKLDRTEKVKKTTAILLEETIAELEKKRKAIEDQNRELEIEASLERVRSVAMGMKMPEDMLDVCKTIGQQLQLLKVKEIRNIQTGIFYESKGSYTNYEFYVKHDKVFITDVDYKNHPVAEKFANQMLKGPNEVFIHGFKGKDVKDWLDYQKTTNVFIDTYLESASSLTYYWYSLGPVAMGISTYFPLSEDEISLFKRFRNVFELAYRRYLDIEQAEAQAMEAKIEAALEKIRSRSLAMHHADELKDVITVLREKLKELGIAMESRTVLILTLRKDSKDFTQWVARPEDLSGKSTSDCFETPYFDHPVIKDFWTTKENGLNFFSRVYTPAEKLSFFKYLFENTDSKKTSEEEKSWILQPGDYAVSAAIENNSAIIISNFSNKLLSENESEILKRFARVLEQAYIRFLDLQKAEAQARESQIETALERVRSKTMAMHNSLDVGNTVVTLFDEFVKLGIKTFRCGIGIIHETKKMEVWTAKPDASGKVNLFAGYLDMMMHPLLQGAYTAWETKQESYVYELEGEDLKEYFNGINNNPHYSLKYDIPSLPSKLIHSEFYFPEGALFAFSLEQLPVETTRIFKRFSGVFGQTYRRYLDLQKAEAQAKEALIQLALERVRARTMAMQRSDELSGAVYILFQQFKELGENPDQATIGIINEGEKVIEYWVTMYGKQIDRVFKFSIDEPHVTNKIFKAWRKNKKSLVIDLTGKELHEFANYRESMGGAKYNPDEERRVINVAFFSKGLLNVQSNEARSEESIRLLERFAAVFDQTYTRFLDLQKAEAQAREAQIEAALERVRSRTMGMQKSEELKEVIQIVYAQFVHLNIQVEHTGFIMDYKERDDMHIWLADKHTVPFQVTIPYFDCAHWNSFNEAKEKGLDFFANHLSFEEKNKFYQDLFKLIPGVPEETLQYYFSCAGLAISTVLLENVGLYIENFSGIPYSDEENATLMRFGKVFQQTYTRFLDLQKAEAQAREAKIEASLEKVRSSAMAMHNSNDISSTTTVVFNELKRLDIESIRCGVALLSKTSRITHVYAAASSDAGQLKTLQRTIEMSDHPSLKAQYDSWLQQKNYFTELKGEELKSYYQLPLFSSTPSYVPSNDFKQGEFGYYIPFTEGLFYAWTKKPYAENEINILTRFKTIIDLTFRRYLDLQKAEARAREAKIEAAMEKVRARAMAMQKPAELVEVAQLLRTEMGLLGVEELETSSIYIQDEINGTTECWYAIQDVRDGEKTLVADHMTINLDDTWVGREMLKFYKGDQKQISIPMKGENRKEWIDYCSQLSKLLQGYYGETIPERTYHLLKFSNGYMGAASPGDISSESWELLKRATNVFSLAYTRFSDLQLAEANAREAVKQSVLDRIRADIASMRTVVDLDRITPLIWNELRILGVPFIRCGVFILDDSQKLIHTFLSTPDGKAIAAFHIPYDTPGNIRHVVAHWHNKKDYIDHWDESAFTEFAATLVKQGALTTPEQYLKTIPHGGFYLHFLPFLQGMLYVGNTDRLADDEIKLIQSVADAFSTAYARYEDFNRLEAAKQQVEKTLEDLRQAQTQLVQSEKMASLGELTAGIAHEIQNPLNFVNNFSDVSGELLEEMKAELEKGNKHDAISIVEDVKKNLEKILYHGKRADAIVKGMLQHSRSSSGQKELTDLNALCDEYVRLAYHGLRAKDKSFNAKFETSFDSNLPRINIVPQDVGRVILNLINNAFYAVTVKKKLRPQNYEPTVTISTRTEKSPLGGLEVLIEVKDNGNGIPQKILDKIFQPFFTTKPTGQGTGLGLSLSYDIIKAHGGEITVDTKEGEGSEFIISIPAM